MYSGLDVNVREKKDLMNSLLVKHSFAAAWNFKRFVAAPKQNNYRSLLTAWPLIQHF